MPLARRLRLITIAWMFGAFWMWTVNGTAWTKFALGAGMQDSAFGVITSLGYVAILFQVPAAYILERWGHRKAIFVIAATLHRLMWVAIAAVPWVIPQVGMRWPFIAALLLISNSCANITGPAWVSWMADVIPKRVRGRYFAVRNRIGMCIGAVAPLAIAFGLDYMEWAFGKDSRDLLRVTSAILAIAGLVGALDILCFRAIPDPAPKPRRPDVHLLAMFRAPLANRSFRWFMAFQFTLNLAVGFMGQYIWLFTLKYLGKTNLWAQWWTTALPMLTQALTYPIWGRIMDRIGKKPLLAVNSFLIIGGSLGWILIGKEWTLLAVIGYAAVLFTTAVWPGLDVANFNIVLGLSGGRENKSGGNAYAALNALAASLGGILSGVLASGIAHYLGDAWVWAIPLLGVPLTYHGVLFVASGVLRLAAAFMTLGIEEPRAVGTRQAISYMTETFYSNIRQVALMPMRTAGQVYRWTDRLSVRPVRRGLSRLTGQAERVK